METKWYWTYKAKSGFHICDYVHLTEGEAKKKYGNALTVKLLWSEKLDLS